jgi:UDP-N-acetyl-D-glucosamine dehydrogenase
VDDLERKLTARTAAIGVVGLGYVGLPLVVGFARAGFPVIGVDIDAGRVEALARGRSHVSDVDAGELERLVAGGRIRASADWAVVPEADVLILCVPTPFTRNREPDLSAVTDAAREIGGRLRPGQLVVLESTTYPGTTEEVVLPLLTASGLAVGRDVGLAYSPERIDPGNRGHHLENTPKVVAGVTARCGALATRLYEAIVVKVVPVSSPRAAELAKLLENIFRHVNIALVNEMAMLCDRMKIDIWEVVEAAATKPFGFMSFSPGPGVGGHCIPVDPMYLSWKAREFDFYSRFIDLAAEINANMPYFVAGKVGRALAERGVALKGARVVVLGVAFKRDIGDVRNSSAFKLMDLLSQDGMDVTFHDPHAPEVEWRGEARRSTPLTPEVLAAAECVVIHTDHSAVDYDEIVRHARVVVDTRNATRNVRAHRDKIVKL